MKKTKYFLLLLTIIFLSGCTKQYVENVVMRELKANLFPFFNPDGLKQMKEHGITFYDQTISNEHYQVEYEFDFKNNTVQINLFGDEITNYYKGKNIDGCGKHGSVEYCKFESFDIKDEFLKSIVESSPLIINLISFSDEYLSSLTLTDTVYDPGGNVDLYGLDYDNVNPSNDPNAKVVLELIGTDNFSTLSLWFNKVHENRKFKYYQYSFRYGGNGGNEVGPRGQNYVMLQLQKE